MKSVNYAECWKKPIMLIVIMLNEVMLSVENKPIMLSVVMLSVVVPSNDMPYCDLS